MAIEGKKEVKGLVRAAGCIFVFWGAVVVIKGILDAFVLSPESRFVPLAEWVGKWAPFEMVYGVSCIIAGILCFDYIKKRGL